jgi:hypothetical protein
MNITAIQNHIIFEFIDSITNAGMFDDTATASGIALLKSVDDSASQARWAKVISAGPDCCAELHTIGCEVMVEHLKWTQGVEFGGGKVWRTDDSNVMLYRVPDLTSGV